MLGRGPLIRLFLFISLVAASLDAAAEDLVQVYRDAQRYDAVYSGARYALEAGREKLPQGRSLLLPTLGLTGSFTTSRVDSESRDPATAPNLNFLRRPEVDGYTLTFSQPVFRLQNWYQFEQGEQQVRQAEAAFGQASQDLIVRVSQAYFDVLSAQDTLGLARAQKAAISEQLAQAKRNFEVGTATITDTHEAQARFDLIVAQEIAAQNDLENMRRAPPNPNNMQDWVDLAQKQSYPVALQEATTEVARLEAKRSFAAHLPTLDFIATYGKTGQGATITSPVGSDVTTTQIGLQFALPLYQGGAISSREREAAALYLKAKDDLENARRQAALTAQQTYLSVINGIAQVGALEQALVSSQSALDSNKLGYGVGVRINIDVLNAQQQLFSTRRDLSTARYNAILNQLRLKSAAGSLRDEDLEEVNRALSF